MKTTMKIHENLNKIKRAVRKITRQLVMASLILAFASCEKEEIFEFDQEVHEVDKAVKATVDIAPKLSLSINQITHNAPYEELGANRTVSFNESFWSVTRKTSYGGRSFSQIWSSPNGSDWTLERNDYSMNVRTMVVHNGKIWAIGSRDSSGRLQTFSSSDGHSWSLGAANPPFSGLDLSSGSTIVFDNKIFVIAKGSNYYQNVYSSPDGINWTLENDNAFHVRKNGTAVVFEDALYYMGGQDLSNENRNTIFKTTNGRHWSRVSGATPTYLDPTEDFPAKSHHAVVVHDNKVWVTGGIVSYGTYSNDVWYSYDMKNWRKYTGHVKFKPLIRPTMLSYTNKILLLGGSYIPAGSRGAVASKYIWSIKPKIKIKGYVPVEIPRDYPTIPGF